MHSFIKNNSSSNGPDENSNLKRDEKTGTKKTSISSEIRSMMTRVDSSIPEVISMIEKNNDGSIQKTISEAIEELSFDAGQSTERNITGEKKWIFSFYES